MKYNKQMKVLEYCETNLKRISKLERIVNEKLD